MSLLDQLKGFLTGVIVRWVLKIGGTYLITIGFANPEPMLTEIVGGIVAIAVGIVISLFQHNKALNTPVK